MTNRRLFVRLPNATSQCTHSHSIRSDTAMATGREGITIFKKIKTEALKSFQFEIYMPVSSNEVKHINIRLRTHIFGTVVIHAFLTFEIKTDLFRLRLRLFRFPITGMGSVDAAALRLTITFTFILYLTCCWLKKREKTVNIIYVRRTLAA